MRQAGWMMAAALLLAGCQREDGTAAVADGTGSNMMTGVATASAAPAATGDGAPAPRAFFPGTWTGPEGLAFVVEAQPGAAAFRVRNRDTLDTVQTFDAVRVGDTLTFVRRGEPLSARPGTGAETGYKWLANKQDCLIVKAGVEGYCRD